MNILFVTDLCPISDDEFGLPFTLLNFILDFKKMGHNVILFRPNVIPNILIRKRKILSEGEYSYKGITCINRNYMTPFFDKKSFKFLKSYNFDVIFSHMPSGILAAQKMSESLNIPYFAAVHSSDIKVLSDIKYCFLWHTIKNAYKKAKMVLPRSYWLSDEIKKIIPTVSDKIAIIPSGLDSNLVLSKEELEIKQNNFKTCPLKIFSAGKLIKRKNFDLLINAVSEIEGVTLEIAGDGAERNRLWELINRLCAKDKIKLLGKLPQNMVYQKMKEADIFALLSVDETFGMVYLEALSKGCIVLNTVNSGMSGFIKDNENGFLVEPEKQKIKTKILEIISSKNYKEIMQNALTTALLMNSERCAENYLKHV